MIQVCGLRKTNTRFSCDRARDRRIVQYTFPIYPDRALRAAVRCGYVLKGPLLGIGMRSMVMNALFWKPPSGYRQDEIRILSFPAADRLSANEPSLSST